MTKQFWLNYFGLKETDRARYPHLFAFIDALEMNNGK